MRETREDWANLLMHCDTNIAWQYSTPCNHCEKNAKNIWIHKITDCPHNSTQRREILISLLREIEIISPTNDASELIGIESTDVLNDIIDTDNGTVPFQDRTIFINTIIGNTVNTDLPIRIQDRLKTVLQSHAVVLVRLQHYHQQCHEPHECTKIESPNGDKIMIHNVDEISSTLSRPNNSLHMD